MLQTHFWWVKVMQYPNSSPPYSHQYYYLLLAPASGLKESLLPNKGSWLLDSDRKANIYQTEFSQNNLITKHHERIVAFDFISALYQTTAPCAPPQTNHFLFHAGHQWRQSDHNYSMVNCVFVFSPPTQPPNGYNIPPHTNTHTKPREGWEEWELTWKIPRHKHCCEDCTLWGKERKGNRQHHSLQKAAALTQGEHSVSGTKAEASQHQLYPGFPHVAVGLETGLLGVQPL